MKKSCSLFTLCVALILIWVLFALSACSPSAFMSEADAIISEAADSSAESVDAKNTLTVRCFTEDYSPLEGCTVKYCAGDVCRLGTTGSDGTVAFEKMDGDADVELLSLPGDLEPSDAVRSEGDNENVITFILPMLDSDAEQTESSASVIAPSDDEFMDSYLLEGIDLTGVKLIMVNYWEPWCGPCKYEMPDLEALYRSYKDKGLLIVGVYGTVEDAENVIAETGVTYPCVLNPSGSFSGLYNSYAVPDTVFLTADFHIIPPTSEEIQQVGYSKEQAEEELAQYPYGFVGSADYDIWEMRVLSRMDSAR